MRKFFLVLLLAALASGCAVRTSSGTQFFWQRGVVLQVIHTCTDHAVVYQAGRGQRAVVMGATPVDIALQPIIPGERTLSVTVQSLDPTGRVVGTFTEQFYIDHQSTTTEVWTIGGGWSGGGRQSRCPR